MISKSVCGKPIQIKNVAPFILEPYLKRPKRQDCLVFRIIGYSCPFCCLKRFILNLILQDDVQVDHGAALIKGKEIRSSALSLLVICGSVHFIIVGHLKHKNFTANNFWNRSNCCRKKYRLIITRQS